MGFGLPVADSDGEHGLVKCGSQILDGSGGRVLDSFGQGFNQLNLVELTSSICIVFNDTGVWIGLHESRAFPAHIIYAFLRMSDSAFGNAEWIGHGQL